MLKILEGSLARFEVPDLLTFLHTSRRTGVLVLERSEQETKLFLRDGRPVFAHTTRPELRLGDMLVRDGKLTSAQLEEFVSQPRAGGLRLGQALVARGVVAEPDLQAQLKVQISEIIFDSFAWREGGFALYDGVPPPATAVTLAIDLNNLLMEGGRRLGERERVRDVFADLSRIVEAVANPEKVKQSVTLTPEEWQVYFLVDGRRSLAEICRLVGRGEQQATLEILHRLLTARLIALSAATVPPAEAQETRRGGPAAGAAPPAAVEFAPASRPRPKVEDDTANVVSRQAVSYLDSARQVTSARLVVVLAEGETSYPLHRDSYTLGRHRNNDIVVNDPKVSGFHARIDRAGEGFVLVDLKSRNGCYVNSRRIQRQALKDGDEIRLGTARLVYRVDHVSSV
jgi:hypothetical protein